MPADLAAAQSLFDRNPFEFERWAVSLLNGTPNAKQVGDHGRDGVVRFFQGRKTKPGEIIVSVKGGKALAPTMLRDLEGTVGRDKKAFGGILVTLWQPTKGMLQHAATAGSFEDPAGNPYPKIQIRTVEDLLNGNIAKLPPVIRPYTEATPVAEDTSVELFDF